MRTIMKTAKEVEEIKNRTVKQDTIKIELQIYRQLHEMMPENFYGDLETHRLGF